MHLILWVVGDFSWDNEEIDVLILSLLGALEITLHGKPIEVDSNYVRALLCLLVFENGFMTAGSSVFVLTAMKSK